MGRKQLFFGIAATTLAVGIFSFEFYKHTNTHSLDQNHTDHHGHHNDHDPQENNNVDKYSSVQPLKEPAELNLDLARIGWHLFRDPNLSSSGQISCESCHDLDSNGADNVSVSVGVQGAGNRNSLTVFNVSNNYRFFWDGRVDTLGNQLDGPIHNPVEMDTSWEEIVDYVSSSSSYKQMFSDARLVIDKEVISDAIVEFQNGLITLNSPFDKYLLGDEKAMDALAMEGWKLFQSQGCIACHRGANIGGGLLMKFGLFGQDKIGADRSKDIGRFDFTKRDADKFIFRVASLRNAANTAPYFHDGQTRTLEEAVMIMASSQLGVDLNNDEIDALVAFISSLSGEKPALLERLENEEG